MTLAVLDINADRLWALVGSAGQLPRMPHLDGDRAELALALSLAGRSILVGRAGLGLVRKSPHLSCTGFLQRLGQPCFWQHRRQRIDPARALSLVFQHVQKQMPELAGVLLLVPSYLTGDQVRTLAELGQNAGLPVTGAVSRTVAAGLSSYTEQPWHNIGIVVDVDEHALICSVLRAGDLELTSLGQRVIPELGLRVWRERLVACVSDLCIRSTRRDPRESPEADQLMFDQLDHVFDQGSQGKSTHVQLQGLHWYQSLRVEAADADAACRGLVGQVVLQIQAALAWAEQHLTTASVYFTANAARLPGLVAECQKHGADRVPVTTLGAAVPAQAAFELGLRIQRGELPAGFFATAASLPNGDRPDSRPVLPFPERKARTASGPT